MVGDMEYVGARTVGRKKEWEIQDVPKELDVYRRVFEKCFCSRSVVEFGGKLGSGSNVDFEFKGVFNITFQYTPSKSEDEKGR
jgi:hypothetical protein